ncbi:hypothetical protein TNCV_2941871 [Trichonephila clavipes]|nr:hypothetical protein TNCV_2941871 [Trichonephila clavipes]
MLLILQLKSSYSDGCNHPFHSELKPDSICTTGTLNISLKTQWRNSPIIARPISVFMILDTEVHDQMFRSGGHSDAPEFSSQGSLVLNYRPPEAVWPFCGTHAPMWHDGVVTVARGDMLKNLKKI